MDLSRVENMLRKYFILGTSDSICSVKFLNWERKRNNPTKTYLWFEVISITSFKRLETSIKYTALKFFGTSTWKCFIFFLYFFILKFLVRYTECSTNRIVTLVVISWSIVSLAMYQSLVSSKLVKRNRGKGVFYIAKLFT